MGTSNSKIVVVSCIAMAAGRHSVSAGPRPWGVSSSLGPRHHPPPLLGHPSDYGVIHVRGGDDSAPAATATATATAAAAAAAADTSTIVETPPSPPPAVQAPAKDDEPSLDEKVYAAMKKLGMSPPNDGDNDYDDDDNNNNNNDNDECKDGVCSMPGQSAESTEASSTTPTVEQDPHAMADSIANEMNVDPRLAMAAIGATSTLGDETTNGQRVYHEDSARAMIQQELDLIEGVPSDSQNVQQLVEEGYDSFMSRRALAFAENNMDDARAILIADQLDEEEEEAAEVAAQEQEDEDEDEEATVRAQLRAEQASKRPDLVNVKGSNFDPTALSSTPKAAPADTSASSQAAPKPASKESVVFEATTSQIQELVLESPVPVLLDVYADWCGPCKVLGPALEEMAVKAGGLFRVVKVNSDNERPVSGALEVTALPTVYGFRDGKIVHMFEGMPKSEDMMKNFMMGLFGAAAFSPPVTADQTAKYQELTTKLIKTAGAASFSFSSRERLTERISNKLDALVEDDSVADVEATATLLRTLMSNILKDPHEQKYRTVNLENKMIAAKIGVNPIALAVLKSVGFGKSGKEMILFKGKKVINVAPLVVARDTIEKWIQKNRKEMATAARKRKDEADRAKLELGTGDEEEDEIEEEEAIKVDPTICNLKLRIDGKKKVHQIVLNENDPLCSILRSLNIEESEEEIQITCVAKRLVVKGSDTAALNKSLRDHGLMPAAAIVVKVGSATSLDGSTSLKDRAAEKKKRKGSHTMQSVGIYSKDDNNKAEFIDGGGGVVYEQYLSDDEEETKEDEAEAPAGSDGDDTKGDDKEGSDDTEEAKE